MQHTISPKTVELIIYISTQWRDRPKCGSIHLAQALFLTDLSRYFKIRTPITDLTYTKQRFGPTPKRR
jgi:hypothetical protein